jgi:predicted DNA-binding antitoxin AbrB/MazE fold protein
MNGVLKLQTVRMKEGERVRRVEKQTVSVFQTLKQRNVDSDPDNGPQGVLAGVDSSLMNAIRTICVLSSRLSELFGVSPFVGSPGVAPRKPVRLALLQTGASQSSQVPGR